MILVVFFECNMTLVIFLNVLLISESLRFMAFQIIFGNLIVPLSFHFTQLMTREGNLIYLGFRGINSWHIQRLWMELFEFHVCFL